MGRFAHVMKPNKTCSFPRNIVYVDTETSEREIDPETHVQTLRLGVAHYHRDSFKGHKARDVVWHFTTPAGFWVELLKLCERDRRLLILAYNAGFDWRILDGFRYLSALEYTPKKVCFAGGAFIMDFRKDKHTIVGIDAMNYFDGTLEKWGEMLGIDKVDVDFHNCTDDELLDHCRADVAILKAIWDKWQAFLVDNNFGHFAVTRAAQSLTIFRHAFMKYPIKIHATDKATTLERDAYYGGRVECFHIGRAPGKKFYVVDINSMYPATMRAVAVPTAYRRLMVRPDLDQLYEAIDNYGIVASVWLKTDEPAYPHRKDKRLIFPIGEFCSTLCGPELKYALERGHITKCDVMAVYQKAVIFREYVDVLYKMRQDYKAEGNRIFEQMVKYMMNSLYGKFGQRSEEWEYVGHNPELEDGHYQEFIQGLNEEIKSYVISGHIWRSLGRQEAYHSFPGISAYITSQSRINLWKLIVRAGRENCFYCDTDSLMVNTAGYRRLKSQLDDTKLGMLKLEYTTKVLEINAPKDYRTDKVTKTKGIPKSAQKIGDAEYKYWEWEGVTGAIRKGNLDRVMMYERRKLLARNYVKGQVSSSGSVSPLVLDDSST